MKYKWIDIDGERVAVKKDFLGWRTVNPPRNEDGSWNFFNILIGGKKGLVFTVIIVLILVVLYFGFQEQIANYKLVAESPCTFCTSCQQAINNVLSSTQTKDLFSDFNISLTKP